MDKREVNGRRVRAAVQVPFAAIRYTTGECNYGGRVTDDKDRQLLITLLEKCCCQEMVSIPRHKLSPSGTYYAPEPGTHQDYLKYDALPPLSLASSGVL